MLNKFKSIEEIGRFSKLTHRAEPFSRLSLVFGRNGYGKSTLCSILRSATEGQAKYIEMRRRLGASGDSRVEASWASGSTYAYSAGKWNACPGKIYIFDQEYVSKNLHIGESVTRENKRSLLPVILGDKGVELSEEVAALDKEQRALAEEMKVQERLIIARCQSVEVKKIIDFCNAIAPDDLEEKIQSWKRKLELAKQSAHIKQKKNPRLFDLSGLSTAGDLLDKTIDEIGDSAVRRVEEHLERHDLGPRAHNWLQYGVNYAPQDCCPFCEQDTTHNKLVSAYKKVFGDEFKSIKEEVELLSKVVDGIRNVSAHIQENDSEILFWASLCELDSKPTLSAEEIEIVKYGFEKLERLIDRKQRNPLGAVGFQSEGDVISRAIDILIKYNNQVIAANNIIEQARADTVTQDINFAANTLARWEAMSEKLVDPVKTATLSYAAAYARVEEIKVNKAKAQKRLTDYTTKTMSARQDAVNSLLQEFGTNFKIVDAKTSYIGREPNTEFAIEIGSHRIKAGDRSDTEPSFKTVLSAGDKNTLALAFFIAQVNADEKLDKAIIVFDDPFSSQDMNRQFQTTSHIRAISAKACQVIVMSHDPRFLNLIEKNADHSIIRSFQLQCNDAGDGCISKWDSSEELKSLYIQQSEMIREYATHQKVLKGQTLNSIRQAIRPFLEDYLRLRFPGRFSDQEHISVMAKAIQDSGKSDPLAHAVSDLFALNEYTRTNMHGGGDASIPSELRAHCQKVVSIVGSY